MIFYVEGDGVDRDNACYNEKCRDRYRAGDRGSDKTRAGADRDNDSYSDRDRNTDRDRGTDISRHRDRERGRGRSRGID